VILRGDEAVPTNNKVMGDTATNLRKTIKNDPVPWSFSSESVNKADRPRE
jgi:hypothetical protein